MAKHRLPGVRDPDAEQGTKTYLGIKAVTKEATRVDGARGAAADVQIVDAKDGDLVKITLEDGIVLWTSVEAAEEDFGIKAGERGQAGDGMLVPPTLRLGRAERGGGWAVKALEILGIDLGKELEEAAARVVVEKLEERVEQQIGKPGLYAVSNEGKLDKSPAVLTSSDEPILIFVHGTASSTDGSFGKLFLQPRWQEIFAGYGRVLALQHRTLSVSPLKNALDLVSALPDGATIDLVSHSRGGLVCELLCRAMRIGDDGKALDAYDDRDKRIISTLRDRSISELPEQSDIDEAEKHKAEELKLLEDLKSKLAEKKPIVRNFVRVACPARGTTLASRRLDRYLSLVANLIGSIPGLAGNPVYDLVMGLLLAVAKKRTDPQEVPGLEAQMPESPLVAMVNRHDVMLASRLTIVSGDIEGGGIWGRLKALATDLFYLEDNDIVVNTSAMYGGAKRTPEARFLFDQGSEVNHFSYFRNSKTVGALADALLKEKPEQFQPLGDRSPPPRVARGLPARATPVPGVFLLPGIMGSRLKKGTNRVWFDAPEIAFGGIEKLSWGESNILPDGVFDDYYGDLADFLSGTHDVIPFDYDWRKSILEEGKRLAGLVEARRERSPEPIRFLAHSMGGLVVRAMAAQKPDLWNKVIGAAGARFVMLGTPNLGAFSIVSTLLARDKTIKQLALLDITNDTKDLLRIISKYPGVLELLPRDQAGAFYSREMWQKLRGADAGKWVEPAAEALAAADSAWMKISSFVFGGDGMAYVAGFDPDPTPIGVRFNENAPKGKGVTMLGTNRGDGRVPWVTGIPAGVPTWYADCVHGDLAKHALAFPAYLELLRTGTTDILRKQPPAAARGVDTEVVEIRETEPDVFPTEDEALAAALGSKPKAKKKAEGAKTKITVTLGDLSFLSMPVAVGHYLNDMLVGPEWVLDRLFDGHLGKMRQLGLYPGNIETAELVTVSDGKPPGALIIGLGKYGELTPDALTDTYTYALRKFAFEKMKNPGDAAETKLQLASLIIGHRESRLTLRDCLVAMLNAVIYANRAFTAKHRISELRIVELYEDTAIDAMRVLRDLCKDPRFESSIYFDGELGKLMGGRRRIGQSSEAGFWRKLMITGEQNPAGRTSLKYTDLSAGARAREVFLETQGTLLAPYLKSATGETATKTEVSKVLFEMLTPAEFKPHAAEKRDMVLIVDEQSAQYPWELLFDRRSKDAEPLAVRVRSMRQFVDTTSTFLPPRSDARGAVVIGDSQSGYIELPGAQQEARRVAGLLRKAKYVVKDVYRGSAMEISNALFLTDARILHLATHGAVEDGTPPRTGAVIGEGAYFTAQEAKQLRPFPELVFLNCCHLGRIGPGLDAERHLWNDRHKLAANLAQQFILSGAKAVVAAGWAVDDEAAAIFAEMFYEKMLDGASFADAVYEARRAVWYKKRECNTWGAYQCYGDPEYRLVGRGPVGASSEDQFGSLQETLVEVDNVSAANDTASQRGRKQAREGVEKLLHRIPEKWKSETAVREGLARVYGEVDLFDDAIKAYAGALAGDDSRSSLKASEQLANLRAKQAVHAWRNEGRDEAASKRAEAAIRQSIRQLDSITQLVEASAGATGPSFAIVERFSLLGSAWKRMAIVTLDKARNKALVEAAKQYESAYENSRRIPNREPDYYPAVNWQLMRALLKQRVDRKLLEEVQGYAAREEARKPSFWALVNAMDSLVVEALVDRKVGERTGKIEAAFKRAWRRGGNYREGRAIKEQLEFIRDMLAGGEPQQHELAKEFEALIAVVDRVLEQAD